MKEYVCGFCLDAAERVVLIQKVKPEWQRGQLNGVGGFIEAGETPEKAMHREWAEETGGSDQLWTMFLSVNWDFNAKVYFFVSRCRDSRVQTMTDEVVSLIDLKRILANEKELKLLPNISWLVAMAISGDEGEMYART